MHRFVALDLELTPFSGDQQRIIEVAAVKFRGRDVADSFSTLVDPCCDLNLRVETLTGICQKQVDRAPDLKVVLPKLVSFIGDDPLVGQSIDLDLEHLARCGVRVSNRFYDTFELATLLLPGLPAYDLGSIAAFLGIAREGEHRALSDALVAGRVFLALLERASRLGLEVIGQINALAARLPDWPFADLFQEVQRLKLKDHFQQPSSSSHRPTGASRSMAPGLASTSPSPSPLHPSPKLVPLDLQQLRAALRPGGSVASALANFEERDEQLRMMDAVAESLNRSEHLLVEAGTGTGKSLAYLLPAIHFAVCNGRPVVISTNTINLQDQLYHKDIPALKDSLPMDFRAALLKGRANYLCLRRWLVLSRSPNLSPAEILLLIRILIWLATTETGDKEELSLSTTDSSLWSRVSAQAESCAVGQCPQFRRGDCFVVRARRKAESSHIIVVNHALLLSDLAASGGVLPEYSHLIVDEAHHLEEEATDQLGFTLSWGDLFSFLATLHQLSADQKPAGFLPELLSALRVALIPAQTMRGIQATVAAAESHVAAALEEGHSFFEALRCFLLDFATDRPAVGTRLRITPAVRSQPGWSEVEVMWTRLSAQIRLLEGQLSLLERQVEELGEDQILEREGVLAEIGGFLSYMESLRTRAEEIICSPSANGIYWISGAGALEELAIRYAPLHVGEALNEKLFSRKECVILTSATLTAEGSFDYIRERLGLENARELMLESPFDYRRTTLLYVVQDIPEPTRPSYQRSVESTITDLVLALEGRTLVLFTSHGQLRLTSSAIRGRLEEQGILVLAHGVDGSRRRLLQTFKTSKKAVLMGTSSFWEGIDVVGDALSCLVMVKLPFSVPTDPIFAARSEAFEEPFRQYAVPQTILRFKQGFGRLIRSRTDRGVVVILDSRVGNKFYGPAFIHSLPRCTLRMGPAAHVAESAKDWLEKGAPSVALGSPRQPELRYHHQH